MTSRTPHPGHFGTWFDGEASTLGEPRSTAEQVLDSLERVAEVGFGRRRLGFGDRRPSQQPRWGSRAALARVAPSPARTGHRRARVPARGAPPAPARPTTWTIRPSGQATRSSSPVSSRPSRNAISEWIVLAGIAVPADLEPGLLTGVPAQEHLLGRRMHDDRRCGDVQWCRPIPWFARRQPITDTAEVARLRRCTRLIAVEGGDERVEEHQVSSTGVRRISCEAAPASWKRRKRRPSAVTEACARAPSPDVHDHERRRAARADRVRCATSRRWCRRGARCPG